MTTLGAILLIGVGAFVCGALIQEAYHRYFPRTVGTAREYECLQGCGARISAAVFMATGGRCLSCEMVEEMFEQMAKGIEA